MQALAAAALYPEVHSGLTSLAQHYRIYLVSNCSEWYLEKFLQHTTVGRLFIDCECFGRTNRPKHENIAAVVKRNQLQSPCYIGDTAGDEDAARQAGLTFYHAAYGFGRPTGRPQAFANFMELARYFLASER